MARLGGAQNGWRGTALQRRREKTGLTGRGSMMVSENNKIAVNSAAELIVVPKIKNIFV
jgi:hypothetical protein